MADATVRGSGRAPAEAWIPGAEVGGHALVRLLGRGGMGEVWLARHAPTGAERALKVVRVTSDLDQVLRFQREGEALGRIHAHPNVVRVHASGVHGGAPWLAMELATGGALDQRLQGGPLPPLEAARIVRDTARGLAHAHARGVLHRDLKPSNVLFAGDGTPKLTDFGLAAVAGASSLTRTGEVMGTPAYMSPEQARGERVADPRADVYGLGAVLYHALVGRPPFTGQHALHTLTRVLTDRLVPPRELRPEVPAALEAICLRALAREVDARFPSAEALAGALDAFLSAPAAVAPARHLLPPAAAVLVACAVGLWIWAPRRSVAPAAPATPSAPASERPAPPASSTPAASTWAERLAHANEPEPRPVDGKSVLEWNGAAASAKALAQVGRPMPDEILRQLKEGAEAGHAKAQHRLGELLLRAQPARAEELLWRASRDPTPVIRPGILLASALLDGPRADRGAARFLLEEALRRAPPGEAWAVDELVDAACAWARLGEPGDLGRALACLRARPDKARDRREELERSRDPTARALLAIALREGWAGKDELQSVELCRELLRCPTDNLARQAIVRWLDLAAIVGDPESRSLHPGPWPELEKVDPRDLMAFDRSRTVWRETDATVQGVWNAVLKNQRDPATLRRLALETCARAATELGELHWTAKPREAREALPCYVLGALRGPRAPEGEAWARIRAGRCLLFGVQGCPPDPAAAVEWLESGVAALEGQVAHPDHLLEGQGLLGICRVSGRGLPQSILPGLEAVASVRAAPAPDGPNAFARLVEESHDPWVHWCCGIVDAERGGVGIYAEIRRAAEGGDTRARVLLEAMASEEARREWRKRATFQVGRLHLNEGRVDQARDMFQRAGRLGHEKAIRRLADLEAGRLGADDEGE